MQNVSRYSGLSTTPKAEMKIQHRQSLFAYITCMLCYLLGGTVSTLMSVYLPVAIPELLQRAVTEQELGEIGAYLSSSSIFGWMIGGLVLGIVSDKFGRIKTLAFATALYGFFTLLVVFVHDWQVLLVYRFFAGMGIGGVLLVSTVYISEIWKESNRPIMLGILAVAFPIGIVLTGGLNVIFDYWKNAFLLGILPLTLALITLFFLPESEKWKQMQGVDNQIFKNLFLQENRRSLFYGSAIFGSVLVGLWGIFSWLPTWVQSLLDNTSDGQTERGLTMVLLGVGGIVGGSLSGFLIQKLGAIKTLMLTFGGCMLACCILFLTNTYFSPIIYAEIAFLTLFLGVSQGALSSYIPALFPVNIRASATGFCFNIARFFTATAVFFVGNLVTFFGGFSNALLSFSVFFVLAIIATYYSSRSSK